MRDERRITWMMDRFHDIPLHWIVGRRIPIHTLLYRLIVHLVISSRTAHNADFRKSKLRDDPLDLKNAPCLVASSSGQQTPIFPPLPPHLAIRSHRSTTCGISIPTLLAESLTLSSSSMFIPGLYLSSSTPYILCERRYAANCSASAGLCFPSAKASRRWLCSDERGALGEMRGGSSRRRER